MIEDVIDTVIRIDDKKKFNSGRVVKKNKVDKCLIMALKFMIRLTKTGRRCTGI